MSWHECVEEGTSIKMTPNTQRASSLEKSAKKTFKFVLGIEVDENNAAVLLKDAYEALLELFHSLLYTKGYKVLNHICVGYFIRDELKDIESFHIFDKYRKIRNSIVYYGENIEKEVAEEAINDIKMLFTKMEKLTKFEE